MTDKNAKEIKKEEKPNRAEDEKQFDFGALWAKLSLHLPTAVVLTALVILTWWLVANVYTTWLTAIPLVIFVLALIYGYLFNYVSLVKTKTIELLTKFKIPLKKGDLEYASLKSVDLDKIGNMAILEATFYIGLWKVVCHFFIYRVVFGFLVAIWRRWPLSVGTYMVEKKDREGNKIQIRMHSFAWRWSMLPNQPFVVKKFWKMDKSDLFAVTLWLSAILVSILEPLVNGGSTGYTHGVYFWLFILVNSAAVADLRDSDLTITELVWCWLTIIWVGSPLINNWVFWLGVDPLFYGPLGALAIHLVIRPICSHFELGQKIKWNAVAFGQLNKSLFKNNNVPATASGD